MPKRPALARLSHEGNSFSPVRTGPAALDLARLPFRHVPPTHLPPYGA